MIVCIIMYIYIIYATAVRRRKSRNKDYDYVITRIMIECVGMRYSCVGRYPCLLSVSYVVARSRHNKWIFGNMEWKKGRLVRITLLDRCLQVSHGNGCVKLEFKELLNAEWYMSTWLYTKNNSGRRRFINLFY